MFSHWYVGPMVCEVSYLWRVSGMWGSVVCRGKWDAGVSGMLWSVLCGASGMGFVGFVSAIFEVSGISKFKESHMIQT